LGAEPIGLDCGGAGAIGFKQDVRGGYMKTFLRVVFIYLPIGLAIAVIALVFFGTENQPAATVVRTATKADVERARALGKRVVQQLLDATAATTLVLSEKDFDGVFALMNRGVRRLAGDATISPVDWMPPSRCGCRGTRFEITSICALGCGLPRAALNSRRRPLEVSNCPAR
jgi:hypothetical protein